METIARVAGAVERLDKETSAREAALFAVPGIDPTHTAMAIEDREIRDWLRSMTRGDRLAILQRASATGQTPWRMLLAMLRSPIPMIDGEMELARDMWQSVKRKANPAEAVVIDNRRASAEWTRRGLSIVGGLGKVAVGWDRNRVLKQIVTSPNEFARDGYRVFGFDDYAQERARVEGIIKKAA